MILEKGDIVIDAGANIGIFSLYASIKVGNKGEVYAFEPVEKTRNILAKSIKINNISNVKIEPFALGDVCGDTIIYIGKCSQVSSIFLKIVK